MGAVHSARSLADDEAPPAGRPPPIAERHPTKPNLHMRLWQMQEEFALSQAQASPKKGSKLKGIVMKQIGKDRVDVSGRQMSIAHHAGRKVRPMGPEMVEMLTQGSPRVGADGALKSARDLKVDAEILLWKSKQRSTPRMLGADASEVAKSAHKMKPNTKQDANEDDHYVLSELASAQQGDRSFLLGMLEPHNLSPDAQHDVAVSEDFLAALKTPPKDRQYEELEHIIEFMDSLTEEPFASMNEFEKLKAAMMCEISSASHGTAVVKRGELPSKLFVLVQGRVAVFEFRLALKRFEKARRAALAQHRQAAKATGEFFDIEKFQEEWVDKRNRFFDQTYRLVDQAQSDQLPDETVHLQRNPGYVCGHEIIVPEGQFIEEMSSRTVVSTCDKHSHSIFLVLNKSNCDELAEIVNKDWGEKAQMLRCIRLTTGVSKLGIKLLAMQAQLQDIAPNSIIEKQGDSPSLIYVIRRGFVRVVRKMVPEVITKKKDKGSHDHSWGPWTKPPTLQHESAEFSSEQRLELKKEAKQKQVIASLQGQFIEMGLLGLTQSFGAVSVLEVSRSHPLCVMPAYIISCRLVTVLTLSRQDVLKISVEDREVMLHNAKVHEDMSTIFGQRGFNPNLHSDEDVTTHNRSLIFSQVLDTHIATEYVKGQHMKKYKNKILNDVVADRQKWQRGVKGPSFVNGPASGVVIRPHKPDDQPDLDTYEVQDHPFSTLGSVAIGLY
eukprot:Tamp_08039.p1 GENE.Tamp_08039~~Tamp_08039.p1  ORF type:complete len:760 (+),score=150.75 Tamp_08039:117-2282(+)